MEQSGHMSFRALDDQPRDLKKDLLLTFPPLPPLSPLSQQLPAIVSGQKHQLQKLPPFSPAYPSPPSYTSSRDPPSLPMPAFPDVPTTELPPIQSFGSKARDDESQNTLPSLSSLTGAAPPPPEPTYSPPPPPTAAASNHWPSLNPLTAYYTPSHLQAADAHSPSRMDLDTASSSAVSSASPARSYEGRASSVSLDDPDVRMAAEALGDLRADFISSPPNRSTPLPTSPPPTFNPSQGSTSEPLFSLLTTSHPLLAKTIEGTTSAYNNSKNLSPRFKTSVEYVEGYLSPIASTVGTVGRAAGVEGGVRWFLGGRKQHSVADPEAEGGSHKRRKIDGMDFGKETLDALARVGTDSPVPHSPATPPAGLFDFTSDRRLSMSTVDTLPAYDDHRSPAYSESVEKTGQLQSGQVTPRAGVGNQAWQSRLVMSTSGLSVAMSQESLRSLKYCLGWLRWANDHIGRIITALKMALEQFETPADDDEGSPSASTSQRDDQAMADLDTQGGAHMSAQDRGELAEKITALKFEVLKTLRDVIDTVSKYAGGALPENARILVRRHLTSFPQRFHLASQTDPSSPPSLDSSEQRGEKEAREGAQRALLLAKEGLEMMTQVSGVLDGTIVSAEEWCERLGRKKKEEKQATTGHGAAPAAPPVVLTDIGVDGDAKMA